MEQRIRSASIYNMPHLRRSWK